MLAQEDKLSIDAVKKLLKFFHRGYKVPPIIHDTIFKVAVEEIEKKHKIVLVKRDPNIDRDRIAAVFVKIINGETTEINPTQVGGFGADFDGDTMAIYVPLSEESQAEAKLKMISATKNQSLFSSSFNISKEMLLGLYTITYFKSNKPAIKIFSVEEATKYDISQPVTYRYDNKVYETTAGRVIFNSFTPNYLPFVNEPVDSKKINQILSYLIRNNMSDYAQTVDILNREGFKYATIYPQTISLDMLSIPDNIKKLKEKLSKEKDPGRQQDIVKEMDAALLIHLEKNVPELYIHIASGAAKGLGSLRQVMVSKGLLNNAVGDLLPPITASLSDGYTSEQYFEGSAAARKGTIDRALNTEYGGYAYRKMIFVMGSTQCDITNANCGTKRGLRIKIDKNLFKRMPGRYVIENNKDVPLTEKHIGQVVSLRSPVFCKSRKICRTCYGELIRQIKTENAGIVAAQQVCSLSEKIMKCSIGLIQHNNELLSFPDLWNKIE